MRGRRTYQAVHVGPRVDRVHHVVDAAHEWTWTREVDEDEPAPRVAIIGPDPIAEDVAEHEPGELVSVVDDDGDPMLARLRVLAWMPGSGPALALAALEALAAGKATAVRVEALSADPVVRVSIGEWGASLAGVLRAVLAARGEAVGGGEVLDVATSVLDLAQVSGFEISGEVADALQSALYGAGGPLENKPNGGPSDAA